MLHQNYLRSTFFTFIKFKIPAHDIGTRGALRIFVRGGGRTKLKKKYFVLHVKSVFIKKNRGGGRCLSLLYTPLVLAATSNWGVEGSERERKITI